MENSNAAQIFRFLFSTFASSYIPFQRNKTLNHNSSPNTFIVVFFFIYNDVNNNFKDVEGLQYVF